MDHSATGGEPASTAAVRLLSLDDAWEVGAVDLAIVSGATVEVSPVWADAPPAAWRSAAVAAQDRADRFERTERRHTARKIDALIEAFEIANEDLRRRYGVNPLRTGSAGEQVFVKQTAISWGLHPKQLSHILHTGIDLRDRLPRTWARLQSGEATWRAADLATRVANGLDAEHWAAFDERSSEIVTGPPGRMKHKLRKARERLQDDTAADRAKTTHENRGVILDVTEDGGATLSWSDVAPDMVAFDEALTRAAIAMHGIEGETRTISQLRADVVHDLLLAGIRQAADGSWQGLQAATRTGVEVKLVLTVPALGWLGHSAEQAELAGYGPIDLETARRLAADATSFVRVLTDPVTGVRLAMDRTAKAPPTDLRRWVETRDQTCRFPGCNRVAALCDVDHAHEWQHMGVTNGDNLVCLCRPDHLAKSNRLLQEELLASGAVRWRTPWRVLIDPPPDGHDPAPAGLLPAGAKPIPTWAPDDTEQENDCPF